MIRTRVVGDVSGLPDHAFGLRSIVFWGIIGFMVVEGSAFLLAAGSYLYLRGQNAAWPPEPIAPPDLLFGTLFTVIMVLSEIPNRWLARQAQAQRKARVQAGVALMVALGLVLLVPRAFEFPHLNVRWDQNAYGSVTWLLMVLHTVHLITDWVDTMVLGAWLFTHEMGPTEFSEVNDNCAYWTFVVWSWLPIYAMVYLAPRFL
jgi:heme/copper-type cytochrome/quinol oxidase subunit 3